MVEEFIEFQDSNATLVNSLLTVSISISRARLSKQLIVDDIEKTTRFYYPVFYIKSETQDSWENKIDVLICYAIDKESKNLCCIKWTDYNDSENYSYHVEDVSIELFSKEAYHCLKDTPRHLNQFIDIPLDDLKKIFESALAKGDLKFFECKYDYKERYLVPDIQPHLTRMEIKEFKDFYLYSNDNKKIIDHIKNNIGIDNLKSGSKLGKFGNILN